MEGGDIQELANRYLETRGNRELEKLMKRLRPGLKIYVFNILKNEMAAEDVVSDTFTKIWEKIHQYNPYWKFSTWAYTIAANEARQWIRKEGKTYTIESIGGMEVVEALLLNNVAFQDNGIDEPTPEEHQNMLYEMANAEIDKLPELYREIMIDRERDDMKYDEIADKHELSINTVKTRIKRARVKIKENVLEALRQEEQ